MLMVFLLICKATMILFPSGAMESEVVARSSSSLFLGAWSLKDDEAPVRNVSQFYLTNSWGRSMVYTSLEAKGYVREYDLNRKTSRDLVSLTKVGPIAKGPGDILIYCDRRNASYVFLMYTQTAIRPLPINDGATPPRPLTAVAWDPIGDSIYAIRRNSKSRALELLRVPFNGEPYSITKYPRRGTVVGLQCYGNFIYIAVNTRDGSGIVDQVEVSHTSPGHLNIMYSYHTPAYISTNSLGVGKVMAQPPNNISVIVHQHGADHLTRFAQYHAEPGYIFPKNSHYLTLTNHYYPIFITNRFSRFNPNDKAIFVISEKYGRLDEIFLA